MIDFRMRPSPGDKAHVLNFLRNFAKGVEDDWATPILGPLYRDPTVNKDDLRKRAGDSLWDMCRLDTLPEWLRVSEHIAKSKHGTLSRRPAYTLPCTVGDSLKDQVDVILRCHPGLRLDKRAARDADVFLAGFYPIGKPRLRPASLARAATAFYGNRSLGYPRFVADRSLMRSYFAESVKVHELGYPVEYARFVPSLIGARSVSRGPNAYSKPRFISQWSRLLGVPEKSVFMPLFDEFSQLPTFCAWKGPEYVNRVVTAFMRGAPGKMLSLDFTQFDAHIPFEVIHRVYSVMASWFEKEFAHLFVFLEAGFTRSGLLCPPPHNYVERMRGVPSGSVLTNMVDSFVNLWVMAYTASLMGGSVLRAMVQGDDGVYVFDNIEDFDALAATLFAELGMTIKMTPDKNLISSMEVRYLQNHHRKDYISKGLYVGVRPVQRASCNMFGHEHAPSQKRGDDRWLVKYNTYRNLQQANNAADHPRFEEMCIWQWSRDPYLKEALEKILRDDHEVYLAHRHLDVGLGERGKLPVRELAWSPVVQTLVRLKRQGRVSH